jgi:hypothetical protein
MCRLYVKLRVALLKAKERPPCLGAGYAVERTVVELDDANASISRL